MLQMLKSIFTKIRLFASLPLLMAGPCFEVNIYSDADVLENGDSRRRVVIEISDTDHCKLLPELPRGEAKGPALVILTTPGFEQMLHLPENTRFTQNELAPDPKQAAFTRTKTVRAGERTSDVTLVRQGEKDGAANEAAVRVDDYILLKRIQYLEIVKDNATRESMSDAAGELASTFSEIIKKTLRPLLTPQYDISDLENYLQTGFRKAFARMLVNALDEDSSRPSGMEAILDALIAEGIPIHQELILDLQNGKTELDAALSKITDDFERAFSIKLASLLRRAGSTKENPGEPVKPEELTLLFARNVLNPALDRAVIEVTGDSKDALTKLLEKAGGRFFGSFGGVILDPTLDSAKIRWRTILTMPGQLLRTNGVPLRNGSILWLHLGADLALRQTRREAESIIMNPAAVAVLRGNVTDLSSEDLLELLASLGSGRERKPNSEIIKLVKSAIDGDADALKKLNAKKEWKAVQKILKIPEK